MAQELFNSQDWIHAADRGDAEAVESLLAAGADVDERTQGSETALMRAAARGHAPLVRVLLERGADPNLRRRDGWTALMLAAFFGHADTARELVRRGADIEAADRHGSTAFKWASSRGHVEVARLLSDASTAAAASVQAQAATETAKVVKADAPRPSAPAIERAPEINSAVTTTTTPVAATRVEPSGEAREATDEVTIAATVRKPTASPAATPPAPAQVSAPAPVSTEAHLHTPVSTHTHVSTPVSAQTHTPAPVSAHTPASSAVPTSERAEEMRAQEMRAERFVVSPEVRREVNEAVARAARVADGGARFWRAAALAMALLAVGGAVAAYKFGGAGAPSAGDGARSAATPEASAQPVAAAPAETQAAVPVTPIATPLPADPAAQGLGTVGLVPGAQPSVPTYFPPATSDATTAAPPVESARPRETYPTGQPAGRASGGEPAVVNLGQSERAADDAPATTRRPQDSGASDNTRGNSTATRPARDDSEQRSARPVRTADEPRPAPTPKGKVVNWP